MRKIAVIPSTLFSKEQAVTMKLQEQPYVVLIPKSILNKYGIFSENLLFNLIIEKEKLSLETCLPTKREINPDTCEVRYE